MLQFADANKTSVDKVDDDSTWPLLFDEFVEWMRKNAATAKAKK